MSDNALKAAMALASAKSHPAKNRATDALTETAKLAIASGKSDAVAKLWDAIPAKSDLNPDAACDAADFFLWQRADFEHAVQFLEPFKSSRDQRVQLRYAQALLLAQKTDEAKKILQSLPTTGELIKQAAMSGASARTIEFFIHDKDIEAGEEAWEKWQSRSPADFLEGYSVLLRVKLMELRHLDREAAKVAEAFADAVQDSSYSPKLLDEASTLLKTIDPKKSTELRETLKKRYPEDPLSQ